MRIISIIFLCFLPLFHSEVKSRLFDYERSAPRSRRQLQNADPSSDSVSRSGSRAVSRAMQADKACHKDIVENVLVARRGSLQPEHLQRRSSVMVDGAGTQRRRSLRPDQTFRRASVADDQSESSGSQRRRKSSLAPELSHRRSSMQTDHRCKQAQLS